MADIFLSYSSNHRERAAELAATLGRFGWTIWWDRTLVVGDDYAREIERQLHGARCVIVLWSASAVGSQWVMDEANVAKTRGVYLPVCLDAAEPPLGLRGAQRANLADWDGSPDDAEFQRLIGGIRRHLNQQPGPAPAPTPLAGRIARYLWSWRAAITAALVAALLAAPLAILGGQPAPAQIMLALTVTRATLTFQDAVGELLTSYASPSLTVSGFDAADLGVVELEPELNKGPQQPRRLVAVDPPASVTFRGTTVEGLRLEAESRLAISQQAGNIVLDALSKPLNVSFSSRGSLSFDCEGCGIASGSAPAVPVTPSGPYTVKPLESPIAGAQLIAIRSDAPGMSVTVDANADAVLFAANHRLAAVRFTATETGPILSSILKGTVEYLSPGAPDSRSETGRVRGSATARRFLSHSHHSDIRRSIVGTEWPDRSPERRPPRRHRRRLADQVRAIAHGVTLGGVHRRNGRPRPCKRELLRGSRTPSQLST